MEPQETTAPVLPEQPQERSRMKMMKRMLMGVGAVLLLAVGGASALLYSPESEAKPPIAWTPSSLSLEVGAGQSTAVEVTFTPDTNAKNVSLWVVPELAPYVSVSPSTFPSVQKGINYAVTVTASASSTASLNVYDGTIHLRQGKKTLARPLPASVEVVWPTFLGGEELGFALQYPPAWVVTEGDDEAFFSNVPDPSAISDEDREKLAFLRILKRSEANPDQQSVQDWFDGNLLPLIEDRFEASSLTTIADHEALQVTLSGIGETRTNIYLAKGADIFEISYGDYARQYLNDYMSIVDSLRIVP